MMALSNWMAIVMKVKHKHCHVLMPPADTTPPAAPASDPPSEKEL